MYQNSWSYAILFLTWCMLDVIVFHLGYFLPFYPPNSPKNGNLKKVKQLAGDIIILHKSTKNHDYMLYCSWDMAHGGCNYFLFWAILCPFTPLTAQKTKISEKWKKWMEIRSFYTIALKIMTRGYTVTEIWHMTHVIFILGYFCPFTPPPSNSSKNQNFKKTEKNPGDIIIFPKIMIRWCTVPEIWWLTDRRTDRQRGREQTDWKSDIRGWVPNLKRAKYFIYMVQWKSSEGKLILT